MLQQEIDTLREKALEIISDYIKVNGKHGFALISYKDNPECYISFTTDGVNRFPYLQSSEFNGNRILKIWQFLNYM